MDVITDNDWELRLSTKSLKNFKIYIWLLYLTYKAVISDIPEVGETSF